MKSTTIHKWHWACLSLFRKTDDGRGGGSCSRVFTLKPAWVWQHWQNLIMVKLGYWPPDPFWVCEKWLRRNNLWDREGTAFFKAIDRCAASCEPGELLRLNGRLFA